MNRIAGWRGKGVTNDVGRAMAAKPEGLRRGARVVLAIAALVLSCASLTAQDAARAADSDGMWSLQGGRHVVGDYMGRESFLVRGGPQLQSTELELANGTVEFAVRFNDNSRFGGIAFRSTEEGGYQTIYLRPRPNGEWDALQYQVIFPGGSTWQLYSEFNARAVVPINEWIPVRLELDGARIEMYLNGEDEPTLVVPRARGLNDGGGLGFWGTEWDPQGAAAFAVANIRITPRQGVRATEVGPPEPEEGVIAEWMVSPKIETAAESLPIRTLPRIPGEGDVAWVEEDGLINLTRMRGNTTDGTPQTVVATVEIESDGARMAPLDLGFSDHVTVFLNGRPIYSGFETWESRHPRYFAGVRFGAEVAWLPLEDGVNELSLAVSDGGFFGWGFKARLLEMEGLRVLPAGGNP